MQLYHNLSDIDLGSTPTVITVGMFDGVHMGHLSVLNKVVEISRRENIPAVVLTFTNHPSSYFNKEAAYLTLSTLNEKAKIMEEIGIDILVAVPFDQLMASLTAQQFATTILTFLLNVKHIVFGYDNHFGQNREGSKEFIDLNFPLIKTHRVTETIFNNEVVSSSLIKQYLLNGQVQVVRSLLNYPYSMTGIVIKGDQLGRTIGFPTANLSVHELSKMIPAHGVYLSKVTSRGNQYYGMTNIGVRPTVTNSKDLRIETHILHFDLDIYGDELSVEFLQRLREEKKFDSFPALIEQLKQDQMEAEKLLAQIHITT